MLQGFDLRAGETYPSIWVPADPADTNTYYPQAIFRNGLSFAVIGTVNLTKQTDGSYKGNFTVPQDPSGLGMIIVETLTIYNDSAHSDSVTQYQIEQIKHKIVNANANFSGGGGDYTDYQYIEKMVKKIIEEAIATIKFEQKDVDFSSLESGIKKIKDRQRPHRKLLEQLGGRIEALEKKQIEFPQGEYENHFNTLLSEVAQNNANLNGRLDEIEPMVKQHLDGQHIADHEAFNQSHKELKEKIDKHLSEMKDHIDSRFEGVDYMAYQRGYEPNKKKKETDFNNLAKGLL